MRAPGVELRDLSRWFGDQRAVDRLRFTVERGELFGIVGPDGAGKTTLLRMLAGVLRPTSGDAVVGGISVAAQREAVKSRIAYKSQRFGLYAVLVTTAYMDEAVRCDRVALLHEGRLIGLAAPRALQAELVGRVFSFSSPRPRRAAEMLRGQPEVRNAVLFGDSIHVTVDGGDAVWRRLRDALRRQGVSVTEAGPVEEPSLEDVFIERVRSSTRAGGPGDERA